MSAPPLLFKAIRAGYSVDEIGALWKYSPQQMAQVLKGEVSVDPVYLDYLELRLGGKMSGSLQAILINKTDRTKVLSREELHLAVGILPAVYKDSLFVTVAFVDVDGLKVVNDTLGHSSGDKVISEVGSGLLNAVRPGDLCCRYGGDEFVLVLPCKSPAAATSALKGLEKRLEGLSRASGTPFSFGITTGVLSASESNDSLVALIDRADRLMYQQKNSKQCSEGALIWVQN